MMTTKSIGWIVAALAIAFAASSNGHLTAKESGRPRLVFIEVTSNIPNSTSYFISDTKTGACWFGAGAGVAPAPAAACQ